MIVECYWLKTSTVCVEQLSMEYLQSVKTVYCFVINVLNKNVGNFPRARVVREQTNSYNHQEIEIKNLNSEMASLKKK